MAMDDYSDGPSDEAKDIVKGLKKKRGGSDEGGGDDQGDKSDSGSASGEAEMTAVEDIGRILKGRDLKESEAGELRDALRRFVQNCDDNDEDDQ